LSGGTVVNRPTAAPNLPQIPGLKVISIAGQGGMGTVYRAEQLSPRRTVAVKVLTRSGGGPEALAAFRREAETIAHLEHPNILPVYGFGEVDGAPYLVLRYLAGGSVALRLRRGPLDLPTAVRWVRSVAAALDFAHSRGLVHRDVKPSNMLLDEAGNAYLSDFGIAAALSAGDDEAGIGSAAYMSPEQGRGEPVDRRADLYALGVSLFEMLTGEKPYTAETALGMIVRHINDAIPSARALNPKTPPAVDDLIRRTMAKDPADRPQTASEFAALLSQAAGQPAEALPVGAGRPAPPTVVVPGGVPPAEAAPRRGVSPLVWAAAGILVICLVGSLLLGGGGLAAILLNRTPTPRPTSTVPAVTATARIAPSPVGQLLADDFSNAASGFAQRSDQDGGVSYTDGALKINVLTKGIEFYAPSKSLNVEDAVVRVDVLPPSGPPSSEVGILCRFVEKADHYDFTAFAISGDGQYKIWKNQDKVVTRFVDWTDLPALPDSGGPVTLTATCSGTHLTLAVGDNIVGEAEDPAPSAGDIGLMAGLREAGKLAVSFDNLVVNQP
jgi:serine/threonine-protein kinase